jgi:ABC-type sugar transport system permease subunit
MKHNRGMMLAFLLPALLAFGIVYLYPTLRTFFMSFFYVQNITDSYSKWEFVGLENYIIQFKSSLFVQSLSNIFSI